MVKDPTADDEFDPTNLERQLVARPLLEEMARLKKLKNDLNYVPQQDENLDTTDVIIDLNFSYHGGLKAAKKATMSLLSTRGIGPAQSAEQYISARKTHLASQYIFARLSPETIRWLAGRVRLGGKEDTEEIPFKERPVFLIWPDFQVESHMYKTVATIKADASRKSFNAEGDGIVWAVLDSGISGDHWHFKRHENLDLDGLDHPLRHMDFTQDWPNPDELSGKARKDAIRDEEDAALTDNYGHGSHVAGIIAGEYITDQINGWAGKGRPPEQDLRMKHEAFVSYKRRKEDDTSDHSSFKRSSISGMAPRTKLVSFKVLNDDGGGDVSNIIAALAQIQAINDYGRFLRIQGVNLSVGYPFNPEWFACGGSPLCVEVDRLVKSGVVVVVSAGNSGYGTKQTQMTRKFRSGMLMTINDPGNARLALTVGSTHRDKPHDYGPSYFSSKGPTGDGRHKPDLLAPGERIFSCGAGREAVGRSRPQDQNRLYLDQSGTSMAAPHVSGAIAAFLSIRREFIGQPERVKDIFIQSATDLGRDRNMQGAGLLDLMRAIQLV